MNTVPNDPVMLLSFVNMKLRDFYPSLEALAEDLEVDAGELMEKAGAAGFEYDRQANRFC